MTSRGDMPHPQYVFSHNPDHGSLFPVAKKKLAGKPQRLEEQKKGLIAPMKDLKIMADDLNVPTQGLHRRHWSNKPLLLLLETLGLPGEFFLCDREQTSVVRIV